jgi:hypothetical protein
MRNLRPGPVRMCVNLDLKYRYARTRTWKTPPLDWKPMRSQKDFDMLGIVLNERFCINWLNDIILNC